MHSSERQEAAERSQKEDAPIYIPVTQKDRRDSIFQVWVAVLEPDNNRLLGYFVGTYSCRKLFNVLPPSPLKREYSIQFDQAVASQEAVDKVKAQTGDSTTSPKSVHFPILDQGLCLTLNQDANATFSLPIILFGTFSILFGVGMAFMLMKQGKDLVRRKKVEQELVTAKNTAEEASVQKGQLLANMSHEIRTPMTAILGYLELIADSCPRRCEFASMEIKGYIDAVQRNGKHLMELINSILDLSKLEAGKVEMIKEPCSLSEVISDVVTLTHPAAESKGLSVSAESFTRLPKTVEVDSFRLRQILVNLIGNAIKFTQEGSIRIKVGLRKKSKDASFDTLILHVEDTGIGIPADRLDSLFSPFSQAESSTDRKFGGTGLGLTISRMLARLMGGDLTVESVEGKGSTFTLNVDVNVPHGTRMLDKLVLSRIKTKALSSRMPTLHSQILLAEDGVDNQRLISTLLKKTGAKVTIAENGQEAVEEAIRAVENHSPYDLILMDMQMPVLDGYGATKRLRNLGYDGPIIALTANAMSGDRKRCIEAGCDDYLRKPIESENLFAAIMRFSQKESLLELTGENQTGYNAVS
ncbi:MAG: ATP-binding protein [Planctomycetia bacterium]